MSQYYFSEGNIFLLPKKREIEMFTKSIIYVFMSLCRMLQKGKITFHVYVLILYNIR